MNVTDNYEPVLIEPTKIEDLVNFLMQTSSGPQEAIGMLHTAIAIIDEMNADQRGEPPRSPEQLGQELTTCLHLAAKAMQ